MNNLTVSNLINANAGKNAFAVRDMASSNPNNLVYLCKNGKTYEDAQKAYSHVEISSWHCEPNYNDNGVINMVEPCRVVVTVNSHM